MKRTLNIFLLVLTLCALSFAQQNNDWLQPAQKLEKRIRFLQRMAQRYRAQKAITALDKAKSKLELAKDQFLHLKYGQAWMNFRKAKQIVDIVERNIFFKPAAKSFMEAEHLIQRAEHLLQNNEDKDLQYLLNRARSFLRDAERAYRNGQFVRGQEFQRIAIFFANRAIALANGKTAGAAEQFNFEEQLRNLRALYQSVQAQAQENSQAQKLLINADAFLKQALKLYRQGEYQRALTQLQIGERLLYRAIDLSQQTEQGQKKRLENNLQSLASYINSIELNAGNNVNALRLLRKARQFLQAARRDAGKGKYTAAANETDLAQRLANRALRFLNNASGDGQSVFGDRLKEVNQLYASLTESPALARDAYTEYFKKRSQQLIRQAQQAHDKGHERLAMAELNFAVRILNRMMTHKAAAEYTPQQIQELQIKYQRLSRVLSQLNTQTDRTILNRELQQAAQQLRQAHYQIAETMLDILQKEVNTLIRRVQNR